MTLAETAVGLGVIGVLLGMVLRVTLGLVHVAREESLRIAGGEFAESLVAEREFLPRPSTHGPVVRSLGSLRWVRRNVAASPGGAGNRGEATLPLAAAGFLERLQGVVRERHLRGHPRGERSIEGHVSYRSGHVMREITVVGGRKGGGAGT